MGIGRTRTGIEGNTYSFIDIGTSFLANFCARFLRAVATGQLLACLLRVNYTTALASRP